MGLMEFMENKKIEIRSPQNLPSHNLRKQELAKYIAEHTAEHMKNMYRFFFGKTTAKLKAELITIISETLAFPKEEQFREWFYSLPELTQRILYYGTFTDFISIPVLEQELGVSLVTKIDRYWQVEWQFIPNLNLDFLPVTNHYNSPITVLPMYLQKALAICMGPPACSELSDCRTEDQTGTWDNSMLISDTFPLLYDALPLAMEGMEDANPEKFARNGFKKREINELRTSTGFLPFNMEGEYAPYGVDMVARFILCMHNFKPKRPNDGQEGIRNLVQAFFNTQTQYPKSWYFPDRANLEYNICIDHLSRAISYSNNDQLPASRKIFHDILLYVAKDGNWFDADKLTEYIRITGKEFSFLERYTEGGLKIKAEYFEIDGLILTHGYQEFRPDGIMRYYLLIRPLFKAYCYIFAALGLLEITQITPPLVRTYRKKQLPFSMYDSLKAIRITGFGRWCLGLTDKCPPRPSQEYQAIADRELFLVTVQGNSLERRVYLDKIGRRLGEDRWRISPASFIAGCINKRQIADRIERFKLLIDSKPAPHWEQLFKKVINRAGLFDVRRSDMLIYNLPEDREIQEELLRDPEIKHIVRRIEGRMLAIAAKDQTKFFTLLGEHGIAHFS